MISGKVLNNAIDDNGNIKVTTEYTLTDGNKITGITRYNFINFTKENVLADIKNKCEGLMQKIYALKKHQDLVKINLSGVEYKCTSVEITIKPEIKDKLGNITQQKETLVIDDK